MPAEGLVAHLLLPPTHPPPSAFGCVIRTKKKEEKNDIKVPKKRSVFLVPACRGIIVTLIG